jgi:hypothetical protein
MYVGQGSFAVALAGRRRSYCIALLDLPITILSFRDI